MSDALNPQPVEEAPVRTGLSIRKLADRTGHTRVKRFDPETGEPYLLNPETNQPEPWPLLGVEWEGPVPEVARVSTTFVDNAVAEGWLHLDEEQVVTRPGGPPTNKAAVSHNFRHCSHMTFNMVSGNYYYKVVHQPDKYVEGEDDDFSMTDDHYNAGNTRVDWFYDIDLVKDNG